MQGGAHAASRPRLAPQVTFSQRVAQYHVAPDRIKHGLTDPSYGCFGRSFRTVSDDSMDVPAIFQAPARGPATTTAAVAGPSDVELARSRTRRHAPGIGICSRNHPSSQGKKITRRERRGRAPRLSGSDGTLDRMEGASLRGPNPSPLVSSRQVEVMPRRASPGSRKFSTLLS